MTHDASTTGILDLPENIQPENSSRPELVLLSDLEASLRASHQAVLDRKVGRLEQLTAQQTSLLETLSGLSAKRIPGTAPAALRSVQKRVLHLARVQLALIRRAQQSLRAVSNVAAGSQAGYVPLAGLPGVVLRGSAGNRGGRHVRCRA